MADISFKQSRGEILRGMMRNPTISKTIKDAIHSPLGSTSRQRARKIFDIMQKLNASHDGLGGPGMQYERMAEAPQPDPVEVPTDAPQGMVIFHKIPTPNIIYGKKSKTFNGEGGPGRYDGKGGPFDMSPFNNASNIYNAPNTQKPNTSYPSLSGISTPSVGASTSSWMSAPTTYTPPAPPTQTTPSVSTPINTQVNPPAPTPVATIPTQLSPIDQRITQLRNIFAPNGVDPYGNTDRSIREQLIQDGYDHQDIIDSIGSGADIFQKIESGLGSFVANITGQKQQKPVTHPGYDQWERPYASSAPDKTNSDTVSSDPWSLTPSKNQNVDSQSGANISGSQTPGTAAINYMKALGVTDPTMTLYNAITKFGITAIVDKAILANEGGSPAGVNNNPGNIKFVGSAGQTDSGIKSSDGGTFANYNSVDDGRKAIADIVTRAARGQMADLYGATPTLVSFANKYTNTDPATQTADNGSGQSPTNTQESGGTPAKSYESTVFDRWKIPEIQSDINTLYSQKDVMSEARDRYLLQTDTAINDLVDKYMSTNDMSLPTNQAEVSSQLQYLYNLRGRANQSYLSQLQNSIAEKENDIKNKTAFYNASLDGAENEIKNATTMTPGQYQAYETAINQIYNSTESDAQKLEDVKTMSIQALNGTIPSITDSLKLQQQQDLITQGPDIDRFLGWDGKTTFTGVNLLDTINKMAVGAPTIKPSNIIAEYERLVGVYIGQPNDMNTTASGTNISTGTKLSALKLAMTQFTNLYNAAVQSKDSTIELLAKSAIYDMGSHFKDMTGGTLMSKAPQIRKAVQSLNPIGWFSSKATPTEASFIKTFTDATGNTGDSNIASALYWAFSKEMSAGGTPAPTPAGIINSWLYGTSSTSTKTIPFTDDQFTQNIGDVYSLYLEQKALGAL